MSAGEDEKICYDCKYAYVGDCDDSGWICTNQNSKHHWEKISLRLDTCDQWEDIHGKQGSVLRNV